MKNYTHLTLEERERMFAYRKMGLKDREIGRRLGRDYRTIAREFERNAPYFQKYIPCKAHRKAQRRLAKQRRQAALKNPFIFVYVRERLRDEWTPEQIAGRLSLEHSNQSIHHETIYRYIYHPKNRREKLYRHLVLHRKKRMKLNGRKPQKEKIKNAISIDFRPKKVNRRKEAGHWESDNLEGKRTDRQVISVTVERQVRQLRIGLVSRTAQAKTNHLNWALSHYPQELRRSITFDNGAENSSHEQISRALGMPTYFCHAYHSWEKGSVENANKRIRRYLPKGMSLDGVTEEELEWIEDRLNNTPMKCLGWLTPNEKMEKILSLS